MNESAPTFEEIIGGQWPIDGPSSVEELVAMSPGHIQKQPWSDDEIETVKRIRSFVLVVRRQAIEMSSSDNLRAPIRKLSELKAALTHEPYPRIDPSPDRWNFYPMKDNGKRCLVPNRNKANTQGDVQGWADVPTGQEVLQRFEHFSQRELFGYYVVWGGTEEILNRAGVHNALSELSTAVPLLDVVFFSRQPQMRFVSLSLGRGEQRHADKRRWIATPAISDVLRDGISFSTHTETELARIRKVAA